MGPRRAPRPVGGWAPRPVPGRSPERGAGGGPGPVSAHEGRFPLCRPDALRELWAGAGLAGVTVAPVEVPTRFTGFADLWEPFLAGQGPAPGYVAALAPAARARLRDTLRAVVPTRPDGTIDLTARAWAVRGRRRAQQSEPDDP